MALDFPSSPSATDVHNAANGLQYVFDGVKWISQGRYDTGAINAEKLDNISSNFNGVLTTFNLKVNNITVKPASAESLHIVLAGHLQEPSTAYTINSVNGTITFATAPSNGTAFFGVVLSRLPIADTTGTSTITNANVAANAAIDGTKINPDFGSQTITGVTTTQSATDNTSKLASTAFVQTAVSNLVDSSPDALNTLNELAAALGDDADFSTTITTALAAKAPLASPTFTGTVSGISYNDLDDLPSGSNLTTEQVQDIVGAMVTGNTETGISVTYDDAGDGTGKLNFETTSSAATSQTFNDNVKAIFGTSNDGLEIYHDGNNSIIDDTGTGDLLLFGSSIKLQRTNSTPESLMIEAFGGNAVKLYYDGALKFETDTAGAKWSGDLFADAFTNSGGGKIKMGPSGALQIYHDNTNSIIDDTGTGSLLVYGSNVIIQESGTSNVIADFHPNTVKLYKSNKEKLVTTDNGIEIKGDSSNGTQGSIQLNCSANSHGVKIESPAHSAGQSYTIILPDNQIAVNKILKVKSISGSGSTAIGQLEFADDSTGSSVTASNINAAFVDTTQFILGAADGDGDDALKLYYGTGSGTSYGVITADNGVHLQFDGANKLETHSTGIKWIGDLFCDDNQKIKLGSSGDLEIYHDQNNSIIDGTGTGSLLLYGEDIIFHEKSDASNRMADFAQDGSTGVRLYYDNSVKLQTTSSGLSVTGNITTGDQITLSGTNPHITFTDSNNNPDFEIYGSAGIWQVWDSTNNVGRLVVNSDGHIDIAGNLDVGAGLDVTGNITVTGTVDGVDIAALNTTVSGIASPTATTINALYPDNGNLILGTGTGDDTLKLYYDGTNGYITGNNGVQLQYDGSTKIQTTNTGASVTGKLNIQHGNEFGLFTSGSYNFQAKFESTDAEAAIVIEDVNSTTDYNRIGVIGNEMQFVVNNSPALHINSSRNVGIGTINPSFPLDVIGTNNTTFDHVSTLSLTGTNAFDSGDAGAGISFSGKFDSAGNITTFAQISGIKGNTATGEYDGMLTFGVRNDAEGVNIERMRITNAGRIGIGTPSPSELVHCRGANASLIIEGTEGTNAKLILKADDGDDPEDIWQLESHPNGYFAIQSLGNNTTGAHFYAVPNGRSELLYDDSKKLETTAGGVTITGTDASDGTIIKGDLRLHKEGGSSSKIKWDGSEGTDGHLELFDDVKLTFGTNSDLQIFHDGSNSYIKEAGTGNVIYEVTDATIEFKKGGSAHLAKFIPNGAVELYHGGSKRFETHSEGTYHYGHSTFIIGDEGESAQLFLYADNGDDNADKWKFAGSTGGPLYIQNYTSGSWESNLILYGNGGVQLYHDNSLKFETMSTGAKWHGDLFCDDNQYLKIGSSADLQLYHNGSNSYINNSIGVNLIVKSNYLYLNDADGYNFIRCEDGSYVSLHYDGGKKLQTVSVGVDISGTLRPDANNSRDLGASDRRWATIYAVNALNTSDENEKKDINNCDLGLDFVNKINPVSYKWKDAQLGSKTHYGLLAQNIEDAVKSVGKTLDDFGAIHKPQQDAMALNYNQLIAPLVKAIQELSAKVAALEAA